jgi:hypothetical protein
MFRWLQTIFARRPYRTAEAWETPPEIRTRLRCASAGIDPATVQEPQDGRTHVLPNQPALEARPPSEPVESTSPRA